MTHNAVSPALAPEPWMRGTHGDLDSMRRGVVHALEQALEDANRWAQKLDNVSFETRLGNLPSVGFHLRHCARSLDRLLTYAEGRQLNDAQLHALTSEHEGTSPSVTLQEFRDELDRSIDRVLHFQPEQFEESRGIGRKRLPTTVGGLLVHCAEHTQRHVGQMVTTAKLVVYLAETG